MVQGVQAAKDGQRDRAAALLREADPDRPEPLGGPLRPGRRPRARRATSRARKSSSPWPPSSSPDSQDVAVALAEVRRRRGEHKLAAEGLSDFVHDHPNAVDARTLYVAALRESGQIDKAIAEAREVLVRKPADASALAELALSHLAKGEKEAAALLAKQALDSNPNSAVAHRATGLLDLANGDDAEAFAEFRKAAQADPKDTTSRLNMGVVLLKAGAYAKAEEQYREILKVSPDDVEAQVGLAAALRGRGRRAAPAEPRARRAPCSRRCWPPTRTTTSALFNLGVLYADFLKRPADAGALFKRFLADAPSDHPLRAEAEKYVSALPPASPPRARQLRDAARAAIGRAWRPGVSAPPGKK